MKTAYGCLLFLGIGLIALILQLIVDQIGIFLYIGLIALVFLIGLSLSGKK